MFLTSTPLPRRNILRALAAAAALPLLNRRTTAQTSVPSWHFIATVAESCSCDVPCPCNWGSNPTRMPCDGNRLISMRSGHYGDIDLSSVAFLITFTMRGWSKIYLSDRVSAREMAAVEALLPLAFGPFRQGMLSLTKAPLAIEMTEQRVAFSVPESAVEMEVMRGTDRKSVKVLNLPNPAYQDYTQYRSVVLRHESADRRFKYSGTTGFTSTMEAGSKA